MVAPVYLYQVADYLENLIETNKVALGILSVHYGEQYRLPETPSLCIEPGTQLNELAGVALPMRLQREHTVYLLIYHSKLEDPETLRRDVDVLAANVEALVHQDPRMGGLVIHSYVSNMQSSYTRKGGAWVRAANVTVTAITKSP